MRFPPVPGILVVAFCLIPAGLVNGALDDALPLTEQEIERICRKHHARWHQVHVAIMEGFSMSPGLQEFIRGFLSERGREACFQGVSSQREPGTYLDVLIEHSFDFSTHGSSDLPDIPGVERHYVDPDYPYVDCQMAAQAQVELSVQHTKGEYSGVLVSSGLPRKDSSKCDSKRWTVGTDRLDFRVRIDTSDLPMSPSDLRADRDVARREVKLRKSLEQRLGALFRRKVHDALPQAPLPLSVRVQRLRGARRYPGETSVDPGSDGRFSGQLADLRAIVAISPLLAIHLAREGLDRGYLLISRDGEEQDREAVSGERRYAVAHIVLEALNRLGDPNVARGLWKEGQPGLRNAGLVAAFYAPLGVAARKWDPRDLTGDLTALVKTWEGGVPRKSWLGRWLGQREAEALIRGLARVRNDDAAQILLNLLRWRLNHVTWQRQSNGRYSPNYARDIDLRYPVFEDLKLDTLLGTALRVLADHRLEETQTLLAPLAGRRLELSSRAARALASFWSAASRKESDDRSRSGRMRGFPSPPPPPSR